MSLGFTRSAAGHLPFIPSSMGLTDKALHPSSLERQNVKLALEVFNENVVIGLKMLGEEHKLYHYLETSRFVAIILNWWYVVNVKTPGKGIRLNHDLMYPVSSVNSEGMLFLKRFLDWLHKWKTTPSSGSLTNETMNAIILTTEGLTKLCEYCLDELNFSYILPGKYQTDLLEGRFGDYRQLGGGQYNISLRQMYEIEQKIRIRSSFSLKIKSKAFGDIVINEFLEPNCPLPSVSDEDRLIDEIQITGSDIDSCNDDIPILMYVAGYCCHSVLKQLKCTSCKEIMVMDECLNINDEAYKLIHCKSRGKLLHPRLPVVNIIIYSYLIISKLCGDLESQYLKVKNQREVAFKITNESSEYSQTFVGARYVYQWSQC